MLIKLKIIEEWIIETHSKPIPWTLVSNIKKFFYVGSTFPKPTKEKNNRNYKEKYSNECHISFKTCNLTDHQMNKKKREYIKDL